MGRACAGDGVDGSAGGDAGVGLGGGGVDGTGGAAVGGSGSVGGGDGLGDERMVGGDGGGVPPVERALDRPVDEAECECDGGRKSDLAVARRAACSGASADCDSGGPVGAVAAPTGTGRRDDTDVDRRRARMALPPWRLRSRSPRS
mmetsp:Transcript_6681/g.21620  ORF Transcript_6681/g.21620 Transcript_6681/m.21620 type:complete len:146 (-) Transcript_6681:1160-1597(-)